LPDRLRVVRIDPHLRPVYQERLAALERLASYPLGQDRFRIDHGPDYFAFFTRLGEPRYYAALEGEDLLAVGAGVLRRVSFRAGEPPRPAWYVCDVKVHPAHRGRRLPLLLMRRSFLWNYLRCRRGYGISMNPGDGSENRVVRIFGHWRWTPARVAGTLLLWSLDADQARAAAPLLRDRRGPLSWLSLQGVKDIVLESTGAPMPLYHAQPGLPQPAGGEPEPRPGAVHMVCALQGDDLATALVGAGLRPQATASVIAHRMRRSDWRFVRTSDI
jgi:hypothetical protein